MADEHPAEQRRRRFPRLDVPEDVRAFDSNGHEIGRVEKVGAGGMQIRMPESRSERQFEPGSRMQIKVVEAGDVQQEVTVEVRVCDGTLLGVQFVS